jgi:heat shock transcription factor
LICSFLDSNNTDLIRWSDDGRSFIVLDEDEFARTLIPELFKHNNYASFVRQLNMYGFHKTVNITDGSLRQSEKARKGVKPPSMYSHPYFRKNRPDLLWLIQKPSAKSNAKRKRDGAVKGEGVDSDDERQYSPGPDGRPGGELGAPGSQGLTQLPRNEINSLRQELKKLQSQQNIISRMIGQLKEQNEQFYRQATAFQQLHDRHENSINAILTFLATFYNRSLEGHPGQNLVNMFSNQSQSTQQQQRGVVEEFNDTHPVTNGEQTHRFVKKPQLLLGAPNGTSGPYARTGGIITESNSRIQSTSPPDSNSPPAAPQTQAGVAAGRTSGSPVIKDDAQTPKVESVPENDQMMSLINSANANNATSDGTPAFDLSALGNYSTAHGLTPQQRSNMLAMINQHGGDSSTNNNALVSPNPPSMQQHMDNIKQNQQQIAQLEQLQKQQDQSVGQLQDHIARLSPGGFNPSEFDGNAIDLVDDINQWLNTDGAETNLDFDFPTTAEGTHSDFDFDSFAAGDDTGADMFQTDVKAVAEHDHLTAPTGTIESLSSESTSPANTNPAGEDTPVPELLHDGPKKKRRTSY